MRTQIPWSCKIRGNCGSKVPEKVSWQVDEREVCFLQRSPGQEELLRQRMSLGCTAWRRKHSSPALGLLCITKRQHKRLGQPSVRDHCEVCLRNSSTSILPITHPWCPMMPHIVLSGHVNYLPCLLVTLFHYEHLLLNQKLSLEQFF